MTLSNVDAPETEAEAKLPRRDKWLLPLLSLLTMFACVALGELIASHFFSTGPTDACRVDDNLIGYRFRPHCVSRVKAAEGPWVTNEYNECGYRTKESCGPKPPGAVRIALLGSSLSFGSNVKYDETFAQRTAHELAPALGRPVEVQNLARPNTSVIVTFHQIDEALALKPDLLLMAISPYDIERIDPDDLQNRWRPITARQLSTATHNRLGALKRANGIVNQSHLAIAAEHFYYQDTANFARMYLHYGDRADYLRQPFTPRWENRFDTLEVLLSEIETKCAAASIPLVLIEVPTLAQAALLKMSDLPAGVDPYALNRRLENIALRHGIQFIDTLDAFKRVPNISQVFYVVDGHINAEGHELVADIIVKQLIRDQRSALFLNKTVQGIQGQERPK